MAKVSICVPVYNVEQFIGRCIESILKQTLSDIEVVIVNDCTPDNSMHIVERYARDDNRICIINHNNNKGLMMARRTGYLSATGDYITFCDSDDALPPNAIELLYKEALKTGADVVSGNLEYIAVSGSKTLLSSRLNYGSDNVSALKSLLRHELRHNLCSKLFKKYLLLNYSYITYEHFINGEDGCLFYQVSSNLTKIVQIQNVVYNYYQNTQSSTQLKLTENGIRNIIILNKTKTQICYYYPDLKCDLYRCISFIINNLYIQGYNKNKLLESIIEEHGLSEFFKPYKYINYFSFKEIVMIYGKRLIYPIRYVFK